MKNKATFWALISLLCLGGAWSFWRMGEARRGQSLGTPPAVKAAAEAVTNVPLRSAVPSVGAGLVVTVEAKAVAARALASQLPAEQAYRLHNTDGKIGQLLRKDDVLLLRNAWMDLANGTPLGVPGSLRAEGDPGSYIVQARGKMGRDFQKLLTGTGGEIVSYVPNNAYLVRMNAGQAGRVAANPQVQAVVPYEPYFKVEPKLLENVLQEKPLLAGQELRLTLFPAQKETALRALAAQPVTVLGETRSPFGPELIVRVGTPDMIATLARMPAVQNIETVTRKVAVNDLTRTRLGVAADPLATNNYLGLTGTNVLVNINDTGVDYLHPDFSNRVFSAAGGTNYLTDADGHGTHVAGTIAGDGTASLTVTNAPPGSNGITNGVFRGMAPGARLLVQGFEAFGTYNDWQLQETAARTNYFGLGRTNVLISNNSWSYSGAFDYTSPSASFDAAVRDAVPETNGAQPVLYVFAAGNAGGANEADGLGGFADSVTAPGSAKNVITVGALENPRGITNQVTRRGQKFNTMLGLTDSSNQVAQMSSRGNVGIGLEGEFGRFKPDVVAPGTFVVSTRSSQWDTNAAFGLTNRISDYATNLTLGANGTNSLALFVGDAGVGFEITLSARTGVSNLPVPLLIYTNRNFVPLPSATAGNFAATNHFLLTDKDAGFTNGVWFYDVVNTNATAVTYNLLQVVYETNDVGDLYQVLQKLDAPLAPYYRYESGTSMSTPAISGMLALMQEYFTKNGLSPSPALYKALLINSARSLSSSYDFLVKKPINHQGWGVPDLQRALADTNLAGGRVIVVDQNATNALATDEVETRLLTVATNAQPYGLRFTLVWTDPPGNPAVGVKLVNNLDLVITNLDTGDVYCGNNFNAGSEFSVPGLFTAADPLDSFTNLVTDVVNNVENVYLPGGVGSQYAVSVVGRRVHVNAVTTQTNGVEQDYALVISSGAPGTVAAPISLTNVTIQSGTAVAKVLTLTNGLPLLGERVGANSSLLVSTNGNTNQWNFYILSNSNLFTNVAVVTFSPPNLSGVANYGYPVPTLRNEEADIDVYMSADPTLTNLNPAALAGAYKSLDRDGTESIILTGTPAAQAQFYIGVKSEDQRAAEYGLAGLASSNAFALQNADGSVDVLFQGVPQAIPDGTSKKPGTTLLVGVNPYPIQIRRAMVTNYFLYHEVVADLTAGLKHERKQVALQNHSTPQGGSIPAGQEGGAYQLFYNDQDEGDIVNQDMRRTDGPGSLTDFIGDKGEGAWLLTLQDNALTAVGAVSNCWVHLEPQLDTDSSGFATRTILANRFYYDFVEVPAGATNLTVSVLFSGGSPADVVEVYLRKGSLPTRGGYDKKAIISQPGGSLTLGLNDVPALSAGTWFLGFYNPQATSITIRYRVKLDLDLTGNGGTAFTQTNNLPLVDDAVTATFTNASIFIPNDAQVVSAQVGIQLEHPRVSDLSIHLVSPAGTRVLLFENRGQLSTTGLGTNRPPTTNFVAMASAGFEADLAQNFGAGMMVSGWTVSNNFVTVVNEPATANSGGQFLSLKQGTITNHLSLVTNRQYQLRYAYRRDPLTPVHWWPGSGNANDLLGTDNGTLMGGATAAAAGKVGTAFTFDGVDDEVNFSTSTANFRTNDFTIDFWIRTTSTRNENVLTKRLTTCTGAENWLDAGKDPSGRIGFSIIEAGPAGPSAPPSRLATYGACNSVTAINDGIFHHVAFVRQNTNVLVYIDGVLDGAGASTNVTDVNNPAPFNLGKSVCPSPGREFFTGTLDEVAIYDRALTGAQIRDIYQADSAGKCGSTHAPSLCPSSGELQIAGGTPAVTAITPTTVWQTNAVLLPLGTNRVVAAFASPNSGLLLDDIVMEELIIDPGIIYTVFTENTNLFPEVIKFAQPPYGTNDGGLQSVVIVSNSFETAGLSNYPAGTQAEGWTVLASNVCVLTDSNYVQFGTNALALNTYPGSNNLVAGAMSRTITNILGKRYRVTFDYSRPPSGLINWWPAESTVADAMDGTVGTASGGVTYEAGVVGQSFKFDGINGRVDLGTNTAVLYRDRLTNGPASLDFSFDFWIKAPAPTARPTVVFSKRETSGPGSFLEARLLPGSGQLEFEMSSDASGANHLILSSVAAVADGTFHHVAVVRQGTNVAIYFDGRADANGGALVPGPDPVSVTNTANLVLGFSPEVPASEDYFLGNLDEFGFHNRAIGTNEIESLYLAGPAGRCDSTHPPGLCGTPQAEVTVHGAVTTLRPRDRWQTFSTVYQATAATDTLSITSVVNGVWIDQVVVEELTVGQYYLPEESLGVFSGENAFGNWQLEIWDTRAGAAIGSVLKSWQLNLVLAPIGPTAQSVSNRLLTSGTVVSNNIVYFVVDVPVSATAATNDLASLSGGGLDLLFSQSGLPDGTRPGDVTLLAGVTSGIATLTTNTPTVLRPGQRYFLGVRNTNPLQINAFTLKVSFDQVDPARLSVTPLTSGQALGAVIPAGPALQYYQLDVSPQAKQIAFEILHPSGNVDLYVRRGMPLPNPSDNGYRSQQPGSANELIGVAAPLSERWYVGVLNRSAGTVTYAVRGTEQKVVAPGNIVTLQDGVAVSGWAGPGITLTNYYKFVIDDDSAGALFEVYNLTGDTALVLRRDLAPAAWQYDFRSDNGGLTSEQIVVRTSDTLDLYGDWYLGVPNNEAFGAAYTIRATKTTNGLLRSGRPLVLITPITIVSGGQVRLRWSSVDGEYYEVQSSTNLTSWNPVQTVTGTGTTTTYTAPSGGGATFYRVLQVTAP